MARDAGEHGFDWGLHLLIRPLSDDFAHQATRHLTPLPTVPAGVCVVYEAIAFVRVHVAHHGRQDVGDLTHSPLARTKLRLHPTAGRKVPNGAKELSAVTASGHHAHADLYGNLFPITTNHSEVVHVDEGAALWIAIECRPQFGEAGPQPLGNEMIDG